PPLDLLDRRLVGVNTNLIADVRGTGPEGAWELKRDGDGWKVVSLTPPAAADRPTVEAFLRPWADLRAARFVAYGPSADLAKYGLDKPAATVTVTGPDGSHALALGKTVEGSEDRYAKLDNSPGVAVLPAGTARGLVRAPLD